MKNSEGFWLGYIDALTVLISFFLLVYVFASKDLEKYKVSNMEMINFTRSWDKAKQKLDTLGAQPKEDLKSGGWKLEIAENILFASSKSDLNNDGIDMIAKIGNILDEFAQNEMVSKTVRIVVGGHTDPSGDRSINLPLSEDRANNVAKILRETMTNQRIKIESIGYGSRYLKENATSYQEHRRITIVIQPIAVKYLE